MDDFGALSLEVISLTLIVPVSFKVVACSGLLSSVVPVELLVSLIAAGALEALEVVVVVFSLIVAASLQTAGSNTKCLLLLLSLIAAVLLLLPEALAVESSEKETK